MGDRRTGWTITDPFGGPSVRVKRWHEVAPDEPFQEAGGDGRGVLFLLTRHGNEGVAREIYADIQGHAAAGQPDDSLDDESWAVVRRAFETHRYVLVSLVPSHTQNFDWTSVSMARRNAYVIKLLIDEYGFPLNGAAGVVGNLDVESGVLPNRLEGSRPDHPLRTRSFGEDVDGKAARGPMVDFSPDEVKNRNYAHRAGPFLPGVGLAQWTSPGRRRGLFARTEAGHKLGTAVLNNLHAQVEYLVYELKHNYPKVDATLRQPSVSVEDACDAVHYHFEAPKALYDQGKARALTEVVRHGHGKHGKDVTVGDLVEARRRYARAARDDYMKEEQADP